MVLSFHLFLKTKMDCGRNEAKNLSNPTKFSFIHPIDDKGVGSNKKMDGKTENDDPTKFNFT